jgi:hypothetical protein
MAAMIFDPHRLALAGFQHDLAEMEEKFRSLARKHLAAERADALLRQLWALEEMPKAGALIEMTKV